MKRPLVANLILAHTVLGLFLGPGCCTLRPTEEKLAVAAAKREVRQRGWRGIRVQSSRFVDGRWLVAIVKKPTKVAGSSAVLEVSRDGRILAFHADLK